LRKKSKKTRDDDILKFKIMNNKTLVWMRFGTG
jgi:hypothetical protein